MTCRSPARARTTASAARAACAAGLALLLPGLAGAACVEVEATADWVALPARGALLDVHAAGTWTARPELRRTGAQGHPADAVPAGAPPRIAEAYPLGALLIASQSKRVWSYRDFSRTVMSAMIAGQPMVTGPLYARINDAPDGLADNEGSLTLCLETAE